MKMQSNRQTITLHDITAEGNLSLKVDVEDGMAGMFSNVSLKQFGASSRGRPVMSKAQPKDNAGTYDILSE